MTRLVYFIVMLLLVSGLCVADEITGKITSVDTKNGTIEISGVKIITKDARIEGEDDRVITLKDLTVGLYVECNGIWTESKEFLASKIETD